MPIPPPRLAAYAARRRSGRLVVGMGVKVRWFLYHLRIPMLYVPSQSKPPPISRHNGFKLILKELSHIFSKNSCFQVLIVMKDSYKK
jgi:hypothetical protein